MTPDLLTLLTPEEAATWALCEGATGSILFSAGEMRAALETIAGLRQRDVALSAFVTRIARLHASPGAENYADKWAMCDLDTLAECAEDRLDLADVRDDVLAEDIEDLRAAMADQQRAFVVALEFAQRKGDEEAERLAAELARVTQERDYYASISEKP